MEKKNFKKCFFFVLFFKKNMKFFFTLKNFLPQKYFLRNIFFYEKKIFTKKKFNKKIFFTDENIFIKKKYFLRQIFFNE